MRLIKTFSLMALVALIASVIVMSPSPTFAQGIGTGYASAIRIQNLGSSAANCTLTAYNEDGTASAYKDVTVGPIAAGSSGYVYTPATSGQDGHTGTDFPSGSFGVVVSCDQQVSAVVTFGNTDKDDAFVGVSQNDASSTLLVPSAYNDFYGYETSYRIMNPTSSSQTVTIEYFEAGSTTAVDSETVTIAANGSAFVEQTDNTALQANTAYSGKVTGTGNLAVIAMVYQTSGKELYASSSFKAGSTGTLNAPVIMNNYYGYNTAMVIQNAGTAETDVEVTFTYNGGNKTLTYSTAGADLGGSASGGKLSPGASWSLNTFGTAIEAQGIPSGNDNGLMSAEVKSTDSQALLMIVNEAATNSRATSYEGKDSGASSVISPLIMKRYYNFNTSIVCKGIGATVSNYSANYQGTELNADGTVKDANSTVTESYTSGAIYPFNSTQLPDLWIGSATITSTEGSFVCIINSDQNELPTPVDHDYLGAFVGLTN